MGYETTIFTAVVSFLILIVGILIKSLLNGLEHLRKDLIEMKKDLGDIKVDIAKHVTREECIEKHGREHSEVLMRFDKVDDKIDKMRWKRNEENRGG